MGVRPDNMPAAERDKPGPFQDAGPALSLPVTAAEALANRDTDPGRAAAYSESERAHQADHQSAGHTYGRIAALRISRHRTLYSYQP